VRRSAEEILKDLIVSLKKILQLLDLDPSCQWRSMYEVALRDAKEVEKAGSKEEGVREICSSFWSVNAKSPFYEYFPATFDPKTGRYTVIPGTEDFEVIRDKIFEFANEIRTVGKY
jgi:hypothetical protein